jgi:succinate-semialdehyde dehydrogenase/glutarate-semialdehyde dehydrogenase
MSTLGTRSGNAIVDTPTTLFIGGTWREAGDRFEVENPATEEVIATVANATTEDASDALEAASGAQALWGSTPSRERAEILRAAFEALTADAAAFSELISLESGKALVEANAEVRYGAEFLRWFSEEAARVRGMYADAPEGGGRLITMRRPVGPCVLVAPWNFPLAMITRKIGPAFAAGCTTVVKPASQTPLTALRLSALLQDVGVPAGVLNVLPTTRPRDVVRVLTQDGRARKLSFTGSTEVGRALLRDASEHVMRTSMELGGNAALIVFEDAELETAVREAVIAKLRNGGESCIAANRIYVHASIVDTFTERLATAMSDWTVGPALQGADIGPLIDAEARESVHELVVDAADRGARIVIGGEKPDGVGYYYPPTVVSAVPAESRILREEIFGPVAPVVAFATESEAIELANATPYGLVAYLFIDTGMVGVNRGVVSNVAAPFGGVKHSGLGREGGAEGIDEYLETRYVLFGGARPPHAATAGDCDAA